MAQQGALVLQPGQGLTGAAPRPLQRFRWLRCTHPGWWEPAEQAGATVTEGQVLGTVSTVDGSQILQTITAPSDGVLMFVTSSPAVTADGLLLGLGAT